MFNITNHYKKQIKTIRKHQFTAGRINTIPKPKNNRICQEYKEIDFLFASVINVKYCNFHGKQYGTSPPKIMKLPFN